MAGKQTDERAAYLRQRALALWVLEQLVPDKQKRAWLCKNGWSLQMTLMAGKGFVSVRVEHSDQKVSLPRTLLALPTELSHLFSESERVEVTITPMATRAKLATVQAKPSSLKRIGLAFSRQRPSAHLALVDRDWREPLQELLQPIGEPSLLRLP